jgi:hypothetical protein
MKIGQDQHLSNWQIAVSEPIHDKTLQVINNQKIFHQQTFSTRYTHHEKSDSENPHPKCPSVNHILSTAPEMKFI